MWIENRTILLSKRRYLYFESEKIINGFWCRFTWILRTDIVNWLSQVRNRSEQKQKYMKRCGKHTETNETRHLIYNIHSGALVWIAGSVSSVLNWNKQKLQNQMALTKKN